MNLLTKEQCENALGILRNVQIGESEDVEQANDIFEKLIEEHFSNPPLKFEKLQERETYYHIYYGWISIRSISDCECILINTLNSDGYKQIEFEEDCFYRKEVQE